MVKRIRLIQRRRTVGLSQERLAEELGVDRTTVFRWEHGETTPQPWHRPNLAMALQVTLDELDALLTDKAKDEQRPLLPPLVMISATANNPADDLAVMRSFRLADRQMGGGHLYTTVTGYLQHTIAPRLFGTNRSTDHHNLFAAAAGLTEMAGWMAHDAGRHDAAEQHFNRALGLSLAGNDTQLAAHILASLSHLAHHRRQPEQAVHFARRGHQSLATGQPHPRVQSRLSAMQARGHAALQQHDECTKQLLLAERTLDRKPGETSSPWVSHFDHAALAAEAARCLRDLGQLDSATRHAEQVIALRPADRPRSRAFAQLMLVSILIAQGKIDQACLTARQALDATRSVSSFLVLQQLGKLGHTLSGHRRNPEVAAFLGLLQEELANRRQRQWFPSSQL